jgi:dTDP-glucose 4,6-dehydratase
LVERICGKLGADYRDVVEVADERPGKDAAYLLDSSKARRALGWQDTIDLDKGLDETIAWVLRNFDVLKQLPLDYIHKP